MEDTKAWKDTQTSVTSRHHTCRHVRSDRSPAGSITLTSIAMPRCLTFIDRFTVRRIVIVVPRRAFQGHYERNIAPRLRLGKTCKTGRVISPVCRLGRMCKVLPRRTCICLSFLLPACDIVAPRPQNLFLALLHLRLLSIEFLLPLLGFRYRNWTGLRRGIVIVRCCARSPLC